MSAFQQETQRYSHVYLVLQYPSHLNDGTLPWNLPKGRLRQERQHGWTSELVWSVHKLAVVLIL